MVVYTKSENSDQINVIIGLVISLKHPFAHDNDRQVFASCKHAYSQFQTQLPGLTTVS